jgi:hypothetical protein
MFSTRCEKNLKTNINYLITEMYLCIRLRDDVNVCVYMCVEGGGGVRTREVLFISCSPIDRIPAAFIII